MRDPEMRAVLKRALSSERVVDEWPLFGTRVDVAVIRPTLLMAYEIKSPADSLTRLAAQVRDYGRVFDICCVVTTDKHRPGVEATLPDWWGVHLVEGDAITCVRGPSVNPDIDPRELVGILWVRELRAMLQQKRVIPEVAKRISHGRLVAMAVDRLSLRELRPLVCKALLNRGATWRPADEDDLRKIRGGGNVMRLSPFRVPGSVHVLRRYA